MISRLNCILLSDAGCFLWVPRGLGGEYSTGELILRSLDLYMFLDDLIARRRLSRFDAN